MASKVLKSISKDEKERARLMSEYKYAVDLQSKLVTAKRQGRQEGKKELQNYILDLIEQGLTREEIKKKLEEQG